MKHSIQSIRKLSLRRVVSVALVLCGLLVASTKLYTQSASANDDETITTIALTGPAINQMNPSGLAESRIRLDGRRFKVEIEDVNLPAGTRFNVLVDNNKVGEIVLGSLRQGELQLNTNDGQFVPPINNGTTIKVTNASGATVVSGAFNSVPAGPGATPFPTATPSPSPSPGSSPDPGQSPSPDETRIFTVLSGAAVNQQTPKGKAEFRLRTDGRSFKVEVEDINLASGTRFLVLVDNRKVGEIILGTLREGELELNTNDGQNVPSVVNGTTVAVTELSGRVLVAGAFSQTPQIPGPSPTPTPTPRPGDDVMFVTTLGGATFNGVMPQGKAEFEVRADGSRKLEVEVEDVNLPGGSLLTVFFNGNEIGKIIMGNLLEGELELNTRDNHVVPASVVGGTVAVVNSNGVTIVAGAFPGTPTMSNAVDDVSFYVRQQYIDFLQRGPDESGLQNWVNTLAGCPDGGYGEDDNPHCDRVHVSAGFYLSNEFRGRGYWAYRFYQVGLGRRPTYSEFVPDMVKIGGSQSQEQELVSKGSFTDSFITRAEFSQKFDRPEFNDAAVYINELERNARVVLANKDDLINAMRNGTRTRAQVLREIVESKQVEDKFFIEGFVSMQYFGYLRRDPDSLGFQNWVNTLNQTGDYRHMIFGFIYSPEYRERFGKP